MSDQASSAAGLQYLGLHHFCDWFDNTVFFRELLSPFIFSACFSNSPPATAAAIFI